MTMEPLHDYVKAYLQAADEALQEAEAIIAKGLVKGTLNRAYYGMFYAASAALLSLGVELPRRHSSIISLFHRHLVQTGKVPRDLHQELTRTFQLRQESDYDVQVRFSPEEAQRALTTARGFVGEMKKVVART